MWPLGNPQAGLDLERKNLLLALADTVPLSPKPSELLGELAWRLQPVLPFDFFLLAFAGSDQKSIASELWSGAQRLPHRFIAPLEQCAAGLVWRVQRPFCRHDLAIEKTFQAEVDWLSKHGIRSCYTFPLSHSHSKLGAMGFATRKSCAHLENDFSYLRTVAQVVALSLDSTLPHTTAKEEAERFRVLIECCAPAPGANGAHIAALLRSLQKWAAEDVVGIYSYEAESHCLRLQTPDRDLSEKMSPGGGSTPLEGTLAGQAFRDRRTLILDYPKLAQLPFPSVKRGLELGVRSLCLCPLLIGDESLGVLKIARRRDLAFSAVDIEFLEHVAERAALMLLRIRQGEIHLDNVQRIESEKRRPSKPGHGRALQLTSSEEYCAPLGAAQGIPFSVAEALIRSEELLTAYFRASNVGFAVIDREFRYLGVNERLAAMHSLPVGAHLGRNMQEVLGNVSELMQPYLERVLSTGQPVADLELSFILPNRSEPGHWVMHYIPIKDADGIVTQIGKVIIEVTEQKRLEDSLHSVSRNLRHEKQRQGVLAGVTQVLACENEVSRAFPKISAYLRRFLHHEYAALALHQGEGGRLLPPMLDFPMGRSMEVGCEIGAYPVGHERALQERSPIVLTCDEVQELDPAVGSSLSSEGLKSICWLPLLHRESAQGVLVLGSTRSDAFRDDNFMLLNQVAQQLSIAIANASTAREIEHLKRRLKQERKHLEGEVRVHHNFGEIVGHSASLQQVLDRISIISSSDATVLILGETGTGKGLVAQAIHRTSKRKHRKFVTLNCAAIPTGLLESELFGHEKGAFTGAVTQKMGRLELADGGTLFLDEIGEIPLELQPKLLRVLQDHEFERLGGTKTIKVDFRLIAATNRNLAKSVAEKQFRADLFYRLNVFPVRLPSLRDRTDDIPDLVRYFVRKFSGELNREIETIPGKTMDALLHWPWPGNVRELENFIERSVILSEGPALHAPVEELQMQTDLSFQPHSLEQTEREHIIRVLCVARGLISGPTGAAERLGLKRSTLQSKMHRLGIAREDYSGKNPR